MVKLPLIGLAGQKGVGKDTVADYLVAQMGYQKTAYADPLKEACQSLFGLSREQLYDQSLKEQPDPYWGKTPRYLMQFLGTELLRSQFDPDIWTRLMEKKLKGDFKGWIIADIRFPNEAEFIKRNGGTVVKIVRPDLENSDNHESEQHDIDSDYVIRNNRSMVELYQEIDHIFEEIITNSRVNGCG